MDTRLHGLDFLRALMMSLGIVLHGAQMYMTMYLGFDYYRDPMSSMTMDGVLIFINTFRMPVFFVLSGFFTALLLYRYGLAGMVRQRCQRIVWPFLLFLPPLSVILGLQWVASSELSATGSFGLDTSYLKNKTALWNNTHHLWFLYYLIILLVFATTTVALWRRIPASIIARVSIHAKKFRGQHGLYWLVLGLLLGSIAAPNHFGRINGAPWFEPYWPAVITFGLCFLSGWCVYLHKMVLDTLALRCWWYLVIALVCFALALYGFFFQGDPDGEHYTFLHSLLAYGNGVSVAFFIAGFLGLFHRYFNTANPRIRYFSDASYWIFMLHQPLLIAVAWPMHSWTIAAESKFLIVCVTTFFLCTWSYDKWVRNTAIGELLNGRRYARGLPN